MDVIQESRSSYQSLVNSTDDGIYLVNKDCEYLFMNKKIIDVLQADENNYVGTSYVNYHSPEETATFKKHIERVFNKGMSAQHEFRSLTSGRYLLQTYSPVVKAPNRVVAVTVIAKDISKRKSMEEELRALSLTDELTGLYNRRGLEAFAEQYLKISKRQNRGIYVLYADLDNLKVINDKLGHSAGDNAIKEIASILVKNFRESDFVARLGGDEFAVMLAGYEGDNVQVINVRLQKSIDEHNLRSQQIFKLSLSVGVSCFNPNMPKALDELLEEADKLMYKSKQLKKDDSLDVSSQVNLDHY